MLNKILNWLFPARSPVTPLGFAVVVGVHEYTYGIYRYRDEARAVAATLPFATTVVPLGPMGHRLISVGFGVLYASDGRVYDVLRSRSDAVMVARHGKGLAVRELFTVCAEA